MKLQSKIALVTGGTEGLGKTLADLLSKKGAVVHTISRREETDCNHTHHAVDITDGGAVQAVIDEIGDIDVLVNAAGIHLSGALADYDAESIEQVVDVNLTGLILVTHAVLPAMLEKKDGIIVNVSSSSGLKSRANESVYAASKWGVKGFTDSLRDELVTSGVRVIGAYPGGMATKFFAKAGTEVSNDDWMDPGDVAAALVYAIEHDMTLTIDELVMNRKKS